MIRIMGIQMKSEYKNATKGEIRNQIVKMGEENYPFERPTLQHDTFWIYCNARRYWGTYGNALVENGIDLSEENILNEFGYPIDNWKYVESHNQREWLALSLKSLEKAEVNYSPKSLKYSPFFDIYTDAVNLFGKYEVAKEYAGVPRKPQGIEYPENETTVNRIIEMYTDDSQERRCEILQEFDIEVDNRLGSMDKDCFDCAVIVDGSNVAYIGKRASLDHLEQFDQYLQDLGFRRDNITIFTDATFPYKCRIDIDDYSMFRERDNRYHMTPAQEPADATILTYAYELYQDDPEHPPLIITNDMYKEFFEQNPKFEVLRQYKRGVTWVLKHKRPTPVINLLNIDL